MVALLVEIVGFSACEGGERFVKSFEFITEQKRFLNLMRSRKITAYKADPIRLQFNRSSWKVLLRLTYDDGVRNSEEVQLSLTPDSGSFNRVFFKIFGVYVEYTLRKLPENDYHDKDEEPGWLGASNRLTSNVFRGCWGTLGGNNKPSMSGVHSNTPSPTATPDPEDEEALSGVNSSSSISDAESQQDIPSVPNPQGAAGGGSKGGKLSPSSISSSKKLLNDKKSPKDELITSKDPPMKVSSYNPLFSRERQADRELEPAAVNSKTAQLAGPKSGSQESVEGCSGNRSPSRLFMRESKRRSVPRTSGTGPSPFANSIAVENDVPLPQGGHSPLPSIQSTGQIHQSPVHMGHGLLAVTALSSEINPSGQQQPPLPSVTLQKSYSVQSSDDVRVAQLRKAAVLRRSMPRPMSATMISETRRAKDMLQKSKHALPKKTFAEYDAVLHQLLREQTMMDEPTARGVLNSVMQEIVPFNKGVPVESRLGWFHKVLAVKESAGEDQDKANESNSSNGGHAADSSPSPGVQDGGDVNPLHCSQSSEAVPAIRPSTNRLAAVQAFQSNGLGKRPVGLLKKLDRSMFPSENPSSQQSLRSAKSAVCLQLQYADADQVSIGANAACSCIALLVAVWYESMGPSALLSPKQLKQHLFAGAEMWHMLSRSEHVRAQYDMSLLDFPVVFQHLRTSKPDLHEHLEAYSQISAGGSNHPGTTFRQFVSQCMSEPGAYFLVVANHCTVAATREDGVVEWVNSLGRCLEPCCRFAYIAEFVDTNDFCEAFVTLNKPCSGVVQVEAHRISFEPPAEGPRFDIFSDGC